MKGHKAPYGGGSMDMMKQLHKLQEQLAITQQKLAEETVTASSGGGVVQITMTGDQHCTEIHIDPDLLKDVDVDMLQDLLLAAVNNALEQSRQLAAERLGPLTGGLPI